MDLGGILRKAVLVKRTTEGAGRLERISNSTTNICPIILKF